MIAAAPNLLLPPPHPVLPVPSLAEIERLCSTEEGLAEYHAWLNARARIIAAAEADPLYRGLPLDCWALADRQLAEPDLDLQINFGWNRGGGKTYRALKLLCEAALEYPAEGAAGYLILGETEDSLKNVQMPVVWHFLKRFIERYNGKMTGPYRVHYKPGTGFTEGLAVIPAGPIRDAKGNITGWRGKSNLWFDTYKGDPGKYEGREFGGRLPIIGRTAEGKAILDLARRPDAPDAPPFEISNPSSEIITFNPAWLDWAAKWLIQNVGAVADEGLALNWLRMLKRRVPYRSGKVIWAYTPIKGITPAIKEAVGVPVIESSAPADAHVSFKNFVADVPGCPKGEMPVTARCAMARTKAVYFHINPQAFHDYFNIVRADCTGKDQRYIERIAFGYSRDTVGRQFGNFGPHNLIKPEDLPDTGTNYMITDPADVRASFTIWVRVKRGTSPDKPVYYIYRDWPDAQTFGDWAVATEREVNEETTKGWDGDKGPAQDNPNLGYAGQKRVWLNCETVSGGGAPERDPYRANLQFEISNLKSTRQEEIFERIVDSRFGPREVQTATGMTCWVWEMEKEHDDPTQPEDKLPPFFFRLADGGRIDLHCIKELLEYRLDDDGQIAVPPRLFVSEECHQVRWALAHYTGKSGEKGASKDVIDTLRYMAGAQLCEITPGMLGSRGGGSY